MLQLIPWEQELVTANVSNCHNWVVIIIKTYFLSSLGDNTPSANSYTLPSLLGSKVPNKQASATYSMSGRPTTGSFSEDLAKTPGPGRYNATAPDTYNRKAAAYSMLGRSYMPGGENAQ